MDEVKRRKISSYFTRKPLDVVDVVPASPDQPTNNGLDHDSDAEDGQVRPRRRRMVSASSFAMDSDDDDQDTRAFDVSRTLPCASSQKKQNPFEGFTFTVKQSRGGNDVSDEDASPVPVRGRARQVAPPPSKSPGSTTQHVPRKQVIAVSSDDEDDEQLLRPTTSSACTAATQRKKALAELVRSTNERGQAARLADHLDPSSTASGSKSDRVADIGPDPGKTRVGQAAGEGRMMLEEKDSALQHCERIARDLQRKLGAASSGEGGYCETEDKLHIVSAQEIFEACGGQRNTPRLKAYQVVGVNFLMLLHNQGMGAILADEMGLGKTCQVVALLAVLRARKEGPPAPHLVVVPASLLENWEFSDLPPTGALMLARELHMWCPGLRVVLYHGAAREEVWEELKFWRRGEKHHGTPPPFDVLLVCYSLFERDSEQSKEDRKRLLSFQFSFLVMDEAHMLKNANSARSKKLKVVARNCQRRLILTGTPLQNDLSELSNLLAFVMPSLFAQGDDPLQDLEEASRSGLEEYLIHRLKTMLGPFMLRRLKSQVMTQMVPKIESLQTLKMTTSQRGFYASTLQRLKKEVGAKGVKGMAVKKISNIFTELRKIAIHPLLTRLVFDDAAIDKLAKLAHGRCYFGDSASLPRVREELLGFSDFQLERLCLEFGNSACKHLPRVVANDMLSGSAKFGYLARLLPELQAKGSKPLIFSQWTSTLDLLEWLLSHLGLSFCRLDGSTAVSERQTLVDDFNHPEGPYFAFLLTTRAGGQGLNLVGADTVIVHDVDFNPQIDRQAEDRAHRIGQTRPVTVHRLITHGTVDERVFEIAQKKKSLDSAVLDEDSGPRANTETKALRDILSSILEGSESSTN